MISKRFFKTKNEVEVTFEIPACNETNSVDLCADFLGWKPQPMKKNSKAKSFKFKTRLPKDQQFEFRYLVNKHQWRNDEAADRYTPNGFGEDNGLVFTHTPT